MFRSLSRSLCALVVLWLVATPLMAQTWYAQPSARYLTEDAPEGFQFHWSAPTSPCGGDCAITAFVGRQTLVNMPDAFGIADFTQGKFGFNRLVPVWDWPWTDSGMVSVAASRQLASFGHSATGDIVALEAELGMAQRFGSQDQLEVWGAFYLRWKQFPWNRVVKTTVAVSTGLNWASGISPHEIRSSQNGEGSQLLHYLSPEITFALPANPEQELVFRFHHRSGGGDMFGPNSIFNNTRGGSNYLNVGVRWRF
ncbi:MAG: hypothetical protein VX874_17980 [Pseudomonadota bacterium]|nr:hypothetical protein [Pseudomonadota bacterium]